MTFLSGVLANKYNEAKHKQESGGRALTERPWGFGDEALSHWAIFLISWQK